MLADAPAQLSNFLRLLCCTDVMFLSLFVATTNLYR